MNTHELHTHAVHHDSIKTRETPRETQPIWGSIWKFDRIDQGHAPNVE